MNKTKLQESNTTVVALLKEAVSVELTNHNIYWGRAVHWDRVGFPKLAAKYREEADEEWTHAGLVADRLAFLGHCAELSPETVPAVDENDGVLDLLEQELAVECQVADQYAEWCGEVLRANDHCTYEVLSSILCDTENHVQWIQQQLRQIDLIGQDNWLTEWR